MSAPSSIDASFRHAITAYQKGETSHAASLCEQILQIQPEHFNALQLSAFLAMQSDPNKAIERLTKVIKLNSHHFPAYYNLGNLYSSLAHYEEALECYENALHLDPAFIDALVNCANALNCLGRHGEALDCYERALKIQPDHLAALNNSGLLLSQLGQHEKALSYFDHALEFQPDHAFTLNNKGELLRTLNRLEEALASLDHALQIEPHFAAALNNRGNVLEDLGQLDAALTSYEQAVQEQPDFAQAWNNRGVTLMLLNRLDEALENFQRALETDPVLYEALNNRGEALRQLGRYDEALTQYVDLYRVAPDHPEVLGNIGHILVHLKRYEEALIQYDLALRLQSGNQNLSNQRAHVLLALNRHQEALDCCEAFLKSNPEVAETWCHRGIALSGLGQPEEALASYERCLQLDPNNTDAQWNSTCCRLLLGDWAQGWHQYEQRWNHDVLEHTRREFAQPLWLGQETLRGKTILLHAEQGFGDTIQFCRYAPLLAQQGAQVLLEIPRDLQRILGSLDGVARLLAHGEPLPAFDYHCPLMSLPLACGTMLDNIPTPTTYLYSDPGLEKAWKERLGSTTQLRIGLAWSGRSTHKKDPIRSIPLSAFAKLFEADIQFVSLQKELRETDRSVMHDYPSLLHFDSSLNDFADTAALINQLDLIISIDTSVAHLAAAMGKPVWILLPLFNDWRWLWQREDSPWYPSARLFRQTVLGDWESVVARVAGELDKLNR